jgi:hypothetical protein
MGSMRIKRGKFVLFHRQHRLGTLFHRSFNFKKLINYQKKMTEKLQAEFKIFMGRDGLGIEIVDGNKYEGNFRDGLPCGHGKKSWTSGEFYVGEWLDGLRHGKGECSYKGGFWILIALIHAR